MASDRARALIPPDRPISVTLPIYLTFGLASRADHIALPGAGGARMGRRDRSLARARGQRGVGRRPSRSSSLSRLMAAEAYQRAWAEYRAGSPAWQKPDPSLGQLEPLMRIVAEAGPVALYNVDENFFPLSVWLKGPMKTSIDELNRVADKLVSAEAELDRAHGDGARDQEAGVRLDASPAPPERFSRTASSRRFGVDAFRTALSEGPRAFFEAYDRAADQQGKALIPLSKAIQDRLAGTPQP